LTWRQPFGKSGVTFVRNDQASHPFVAVIGTPDRATFADTMLEDISNGLCANGLHARQFTVSSDAGLPRLQQQLEAITRDEEHIFLVDLNGNFNAKMTQSRFASLRFTYLIDHPFRHAHKFDGYDAPLVAGIVDATHKEALHDIGSNIPSIFVPHAGPPQSDFCLPVTERGIDILFVGNISPIIYEAPFNERVRGLPNHSVAVIERAVDLALEDRLYPYDAFKTAVAEEAPQLLRNTRLSELRETFIIVETLLASRQRFEALKTIAQIDGLNIHLVGNIAEVLEHGERLDKGSGVSIHSHIPFNQVLLMMERTKIIINANFTIVGGSHERIWQGMAHGCLVLTNDSLYMRSCFENETNILFFPERLTNLPALLYETIRQPAKLQKMVDRASALYQENHTWKARTQDLSSLFRSFAPA